MKVALIGASGFVGTAVLHELLSREHFVTALVQHPEKLSPQENLHIVKADAYNEDDVATTVKDHDVVVNTFNAGWTNPNLYNDFLKGSKAIQAGVEKSGVKRLFVSGGAGSLYINGAQLVDSPDFPAEYKAGATAARDYYLYLKDNTNLDWTYLSPAIEMNQSTGGKRIGTYRTGLESPVFDDNGRSVISVEDMAIAIVDELENPKHIKKRFTVAY